MPYAKSSATYFAANSRTDDPLIKQNLTKHQKHGGFAKLIRGLVGGYHKPFTAHRHTNCAYAYFTATTSGDFTITINGVDTVVSFTSSQTATATAAVAALNALTANALVYGGRNIEADNRKATLTLTSTAIGMTFQLGAYTFTAVQKAADNPSQFEVSGSDTADAGKLVTAINTHPGTKDLVVADNSAGVVTIRSRRASTPDRDLQLKVSSESLSAAVLTASTVVTVSCVQPGVMGNWITTAVAGTGSAVSGARMTGGVTVYETL